MAELNTDAGTVKDGPYAEVVTELRTRYEYATNEWRDIREEGSLDMRYVSGDPWDPTDRQIREEARRPVMSFDEFGQYVNQLINTIRLHKRAIHVTPIGSGANDKTAQFRADLIRQIEYRSNAQEAYTTGFENTVQRSYGVWRVKARYVTQPKASGGDGSGFNQELVIVPCPNPDLITPDPDILSRTGADMKYLFQAESWALEDYRKKFPQAKVEDFNGELAKDAPTWISERRIQLAEYWTIEDTRRKLLLFRQAMPADQGAPLRDLEVFEDELTDKKGLTKWGRVVEGKTHDRERFVDVPTVKQYLTNGFEILGEPTIWPGPSIPFICCFGKIIYVDRGAGNKREILSLVRLARDPAMLLSYIKSCEAEIIGGVPRATVIGYEGQFRGHESDWQKANHEPVPFLQVRAQTETTGSIVLPLPERQSWDPPLGNLEIAAESARRAIQAAMGGAPLPTQAQRRNEKSGKALQEIRSAEQQGSFHFVDAYEAAVTRTGVILDELLDHYYDTARDVTIRTQADETQIVRINDTEQFAEGQHEPIETGRGQHDITLSTGPASDSERETANEFADQLVANIPAIAPIIGPKAAAQLMALSIRLKNIGPLGDEMADLIVPPEIEEGQVNPAQVQQQLDQVTQLLQQAQQMIATDQVKTEAELNKVKIQEVAESERKGADLKSKERLAQLEAESRLQLERMKIVADLLKTRATIEQKQTEAMIDAATAELDREVAIAGAREERQAVSEEAERGRQHEADEAARARQAASADAAQDQGA